LRARFVVYVIALRRNHGNKANISIAPGDQAVKGDCRVAVDENKALKKLEWI